MAIYQRQYEKILAAETLRFLLLGRLPNLNDISKRISSVIDKKNNITYKYVPQPTREIFRNELYNKSLRSIKFDIDTFHEELLDLFSQSSSRLNYADLYHKLNSYELRNLQSKLEMLLFTVQDADFYFSGAFDTFSDTSKTDLKQSTNEIVDLSEQCLALPYLGNSTKRINMDSLIPQTTINVDVVSKNGAQIQSINQIPSSSFGNIFTDTLSIWGYEVITNSNEPVDLTFTFPLNNKNGLESEFFVSRFEVVPHSINKQSVIIKTSNDDVNYLSILGYEQGIETTDQKITYAMDFETTLVQYVRVTLHKEEADEEIVSNTGSLKSYKYLFGLKKFSAFTTGRLTKATYISKPFSFTDSSIIGRVSIDADESIPNGCSLSYSIASADSNGNQLSSYIPISPVNGNTTIGIDKIINFGSTIENNNQFTVMFDGDDSPQAYGSPFQGKQFYRIGPAVINTPIFGTSLLYRGFKSWFRDTSGSFEIINIANNYINFQQSNIESMFATTTEVPELITLTVQNYIRRVYLQLTKAPYYDTSKGHAMTPVAGQDSSLDTRPNYAIYKIIKRGSTVRTSTSSFGLTSNNLYLPVDSFIIQSNQSSDLPTLQLTNGQPFRFGTDYTFETIDSGGVPKPTGRLIIPEDSSLRDANGVINYLVTFTYTPDLDITHKVARINGNSITLDHSNLTLQDSIEITYRFVPISPSQIIKASIRVANLPSSSSGIIFYVEGRDYVINANTGNIQKVAGGQISDNGIYVQFSYRNSTSTLQTFTTWCDIAPSEGTQIKFDLNPSTKKNKLIVDTDVGEAFYISTPQGLINLTSATSTPVLPSGWVQLIVRSKSPTDNVEYGTNLIDQVIQLKDINKKKIFKQYNNYFNQITAFREPLVERTLNHLKVNTLLSDHSVFAIDTITDPNNSYIVINFSPNNTTEIYNKVPTDDADESNPPSTSPEDFLLTWVSKIDSSEAPSNIIVRVELNRNQDTDGAQTPKLFGYKLRVGS